MVRDRRHIRLCTTPMARDRRHPTRMKYGLDDVCWPFDNRGRMWPKFPDIRLAIEGKDRKTWTRNMTRAGIKPWSSAWKVTMVSRKLGRIYTIMRNVRRGMFAEKCEYRYPYIKKHHYTLLALFRVFGTYPRIVVCFFFYFNSKINLKIIFRKLMGQLNWYFVCFLYSKSYICSIKFIKFWQLIWQFQNSTKLSPSVP